MNKHGPCELCERERPLTFHHLVPKKVHKKKRVLRLFSRQEMHQTGIWVCTDCHHTIHRQIKHLELALEYNSLEKLKAHPGIARFIDWVARQDKRAKKR